MLRDLVRLSLSLVLLLLSLPFLAISFTVAALCAAVAAVFPRFHRQRETEIEKLQSANEFDFDNALAAYEQLIGTHAGRRP